MTGPGTLIADRYKVVRHLGSGAMASVHLADDQLLGRQVAIKSVHADAKSDFGRRVQREARMGASLAHPNLVAVFDTIVHEDALLIVMEYVPGRTLADELNGRPDGPERALAILRPLAAALDHIHSAGVVHRDVKPANVLLHERGDVKLADLGVATSDEVSRITHSGGVVGTAAYMAPEQFESGPVDAAADVYALAAVAFEMLAGRRAFPAPDALAALVQRSQDPPDLRELVPDTPQAAADSLKRGLAESRRPPDHGDRARRRARSGLPPARRRGRGGASRRPSRLRPPPVPLPLRASPSRWYREVRRSLLLGTARDGGRRLSRCSGCLLAGVVLALVLAASGDDEPSGGRAAAPDAESAPTRPRRRPRRPRRRRRRPTPDGAVRAFYERAAEGDLDGAWELAAPARASSSAATGRRSTTRSTRSSASSSRACGRPTSPTPAPPSRSRPSRPHGPHRALRGRDADRSEDGETWVVARVGVRCSAG